MDSVDPRSLHLFDKQPSLSLSPAAAWYFRSICRTLQVKGSLSEFLAVKGKGHNLSHELLSVDTSHVESPKMTRDHWISVPSTWQASWRKMLLCLCCIISSSTSEQVVLFSWDCSYELRRHRCHLLFRCLNVTSEVSDTHGKLDQVLCDAGWLDLAVFNGSQHGSGRCCLFHQFSKCQGCSSLPETNEVQCKEGVTFKMFWSPETAARFIFGVETTLLSDFWIPHTDIPNHR